MDLETLKHWAFGMPIPTRAQEQEKLNVPLGLAVYAADAISSTAFATDEILIALAGSAYAAQMNAISLAVAAAIVILIALVVTSYRQVIRAYPEGGGAYIVAKENLGALPSHIAAGALLTDYILTVSVNICAGVAAITSTGILPHHERVLISILFGLFIAFVNLRGLRESGKTFAFPAYCFITSMAILIGTGLWKLAFNTPAGLSHFSFFSGGIFPTNSTDFNFYSVTYLLIFLKAFSHGCAGLTGIEAVSNGVKAFKNPAVKRANQTMVLMGLLLSGIFMGITFLSYGFRIIPHADQTVISQLGHQVFAGITLFNLPLGHFLYLLVQFSTMIMLVLAANTAFADFPRVCNLLAQDGYLPRQFKNIGDRLVYNTGIKVLTCFSLFLIWLFRADLHALMPLYALGVFISFTSTQSGLVVHHWRLREPGWLTGIAINLIGAVVTALVCIILTVEKFKEGAWIIVLTLPLIILLFHLIHRHYQSVARQLALPKGSDFCPTPQEHPALVMIFALNRGTLPALEYALSISHQVEAVHISVDEKATQTLKETWEGWHCKDKIKLTILESPYRSINQPFIDYLEEVSARYPHELVSVIIPEFVTPHWWQSFLHNRAAVTLKALLRKKKGKIVTFVQYYLADDQ